MEALVHVGARAVADTHGYIDAALEGQRAAHMLPWAVRELATNAIAGSTRYHDIVPAADRVEIGYTWYAERWQKTKVNTACKLLLLTHAFESLVVALSDCAPITSTSNRSARSRRSAQRKTASFAIIIRGATAPCAIR